LKKILIIDDDPVMRALLSEALSHAYAVSTAGDGAEGVETLKRDKHDLVVLDLLMPRMHGFEVCQHIREDPELTGVKIIVSSSKAYDSDIKTAKTAGADCYLVKPYKMEDIRARIAELLGETR
jgi:two-component system, OmpR family, alkaline phosphatase synthesis response regulator PhoP